MKKQVWGWLLIIGMTKCAVKAQPIPSVRDSTVTRPVSSTAQPPSPVLSLRPYVVPVALMAGGLITQGPISRQVRQTILDRFPHFQSRVDDYLQLVPTVAVISLGAAGVKGQHAFGDQLALLVLSHGVAQGLTHGLKKAVAYPRPDHTTSDAFPSGHTADAFTGATLLAREYGESNSWYAVAGYAAATTVGGLRMVKNRHWLSDVLFGAGVGIGSTELVYELYPWLKHLVVRQKHTVLMPTYGGYGPGFCLISVF